MDHLKNFLAGMRRAIDLVPAPREYILPHRDGFARDAAQLRGDFGAIGRDMRAVLKHDESTNYRTR